MLALFPTEACFILDHVKSYQQLIRGYYVTVTRTLYHCNLCTIRNITLDSILLIDM